MSQWLGIVVLVYGFSLLLSGVMELYESLFAPGKQRRAARSRHSQFFQESGGPAGFSRARPGASVEFRHPENGPQRSVIRGTIRYVELWQRRSHPSEPWVPTGNRFTAHWTGEALLYAWKGDLWLLDRFEQISDAEIKQHFAGPARRFGASDETARVNFAYPPGSWLITDIGKFRVEATWGEGLRLTPGANGRFIHAGGGTGLEGRALVVEDYLEGHGGHDTVWRGWKIEWDDLLQIEA